jgi:DinB superfamily
VVGQWKEVFMERPFVIENDRERKRLQLLVDRITEEELSLPLGEGWTIAAAFAHLAFWDQRALVLMRKWKKTAVAPSPIDDDVANDALLPHCLAIPPRIAARLAGSAAEAIDLELERASDNLITDISKLGDRFRLYRSDHRKLHLDQIENLLRARRGKT